LEAACSQEWLPHLAKEWLNHSNQETLLQAFPVDGVDGGSISMPAVRVG